MSKVPKKLMVGGVRSGSLLDWKGKLAAVVYTSGCCFRCPFCHNPGLVFGREAKQIEVGDLLEKLRPERSWLDGVVITGGEPTIQPGLPGFIQDLKQEGLAVKLDTNGAYPQVVRLLLEQGLLAMVAMDLKTVPSRYDEACGVKVDIPRIKETIRLLLETDIEIEFRTTVVPGLVSLDDIAELAQLAGGDSRYVLQQFRPGGCLDPEFNEVKPYPEEQLEKARKELSRYSPTRLVRGA